MPERVGYAYIAPRYIYVDGRPVYYRGYWQGDNGYREYGYGGYRGAPPAAWRGRRRPRRRSGARSPRTRSGAAPRPRRRRPRGWLARWRRDAASGARDGFPRQPHDPTAPPPAGGWRGGAALRPATPPPAGRMAGAARLPARPSTAPPPAMPPATGLARRRRRPRAGRRAPLPVVRAGRLARGHAVLAHRLRRRRRRQVRSPAWRPVAGVARRPA